MFQVALEKVISVLLDHALPFPKNPTQSLRMESVRSFLLFLLSSLSLVHPKMSEKAGKRKQKVVTVGGGVTGSLLARELSSKLNRAEYELLLVEARPYAIWLIAGARLVTEEGHDHPRLEERAFVSYDKLFHNGNGSVKLGKAVYIHSSRHTTSADTRGNEGDKRTDDQNHSGHVLLEDGEKVFYDALILATGSKYSGPVDFPEDPVECQAHLEYWRAAFKEAKDVMLVGGGGVAIGKRFRVITELFLAEVYVRVGRRTQGLLSRVCSPYLMSYAGNERFAGKESRDRPRTGTVTERAVPRQVQETRQSKTGGEGCRTCPRRLCGRVPGKKRARGRLPLWKEA